MSDAKNPAKACDKIIQDTSRHVVPYASCLQSPASLPIPSLLRLKRPYILLTVSIWPHSDIPLMVNVQRSRLSEKSKGSALYGNDEDI